MALLETAMNSPSEPKPNCSPNTYRHKLVFLVGPSGSGKTKVARLLAPQLSYEVIDIDNLIEVTQGMTISNIFKQLGEPHFRRLEEEAILNLVSSDQRAIVATGGGLPIIDGMMDKLRAHGLVVYLKAEVDTLWGRLDSDPKELDSRPLLQKGGIDSLRAMVARRDPVYSMSNLVFRTDSLDINEVCAALLGLITAPNGEVKG